MGGTANGFHPGRELEQWFECGDVRFELELGALEYEQQCGIPLRSVSFIEAGPISSSNLGATVPEMLLAPSFLFVWRPETYKKDIPARIPVNARKHSFHVHGVSGLFIE